MRCYALLSPVQSITPQRSFTRTVSKLRRKALLSIEYNKFIFKAMVSLLMCEINVFYRESFFLQSLWVTWVYGLMY